MKKTLFLIAAGLIYTTNVYAQEGETQQEAACNYVAKMAAVTMTARQAGITKDSLLKKINSEKDVGGVLLKMEKSMINDAYQEKIYPSSEEQKESVIMFATSKMQQCIDM